jgi:hypothetical protein
VTTDLTSDQRALVDFLLSREFAGRAELMEQAITVRTAGPSCGCGCPSFSLVPDTSLAPAKIVDPPVASEAYGTDPEGNSIGVLLFVGEEGYLREVEVYSRDGGFGGLPTPSALKLSDLERAEGRHAGSAEPLALQRP